MTDIEILTTKAQTFLRTAERAMSDGDYDSCASRCYYAMFSVAQAALLTKDLRASTHKGVIGLFGQHFVRTGIFDGPMGRALNYAYDTRIVGDYGVTASVAQDQAEDLLDAAQGFIQKVRTYLDQWMEKEGEM